MTRKFLALAGVLMAALPLPAAAYDLPRTEAYFQLIDDDDDRWQRGRCWDDDDDDNDDDD